MGKDYALESEGAEITFSTSSHPKYQPEFMIDGDEKSFFMTTGCFPQTFTIKLKNVVNISNITMVSSGIKDIVIEALDEEDNDSEWREIASKTLENGKGSLQNQKYQVSVNTSSLRFTIKNGYYEFVSIHKLNITGQ